ncbi:hypothetical protein HDU87_006527 [Geranomyces variabilis]|uniref:Uncharacterized protein n=1 Tax=Geranomyces variabilis TaxID=109894 RepID=A0AAD5XKZ4_9FUNG|nr:hypothetical protein HDU87_006527 [Geranomyces variabilis]
MPSPSSSPTQPLLSLAAGPHAAGTLAADLCAASLNSLASRALSPSLASARTAHLRAAILQAHISDAILDPSLDLSTLSEPLTQLLRTAEASTLPSPQPLGISPQSWEDRHLPSAKRKVPENLIELLVADVERRLAGTCAVLSAAAFKTPAAKTQSGIALAAAKAHGLTLHFTALRQQTTANRRQSARLHIQIIHRTRACAERWFSLLTSLHAAIAIHACELEPSAHKAFGECFEAIARNAMLKMRCLEAEMRLALCEGADAARLKAARAELDAARAVAERGLADADAQLARYRHVGKEFGQTVGAYSDVLRSMAVVEKDIGRMGGGRAGGI